MRVAGTTWTTRLEAAQALTGWATTHQHAVRAATREAPLEVGEIAGHTILAHADTTTGQPNTASASSTGPSPAAGGPDGLSRGYEPAVVLSLRDVPGSANLTRLAEVLDHPNLGLVRTLENKPAAIERRITDHESKLAATRRELDDAASRIGQPFPRADQLQVAAKRVRDIDQALAETTHDDAQTHPPHDTSDEHTDPTAPRPSPRDPPETAQENTDAVVEVVRHQAGTGTSAQKKTPPAPGGPAGQPRRPPGPDR